MEVRRTIATVAGAATLLFATPASATTETFTFTGASQTWTVPAGVTEATFDVYGAQGAGFDDPLFAGGLGGRAAATISVAPGASVEVNVGGQDGFNGGGGGNNPGGGASDVRVGGSGLGERVLVAGGGGGSGNANCFPGGVFGGAGGGENGDGAPSGCGRFGGGGGAQDHGGTAISPATAGGFGVGGNGSSGGGGGGWYGGGGGSNGGGGGSGHGPPGTVFETGVHSGDGLVTITYVARFALDLTTEGSGAGYVDSSPAGVDCGNNTSDHDDCSEIFDAGTLVTLTARPDAGSEFGGFAGGGCAGASPCSVTMDQARSVSATFTAQPPTCQGEDATIVVSAPGQTTSGTDGPDVIVGTDGSDEIRALGGDDVVCGLGDDDKVLGGTGGDALSGGKGKDYLLGGGGADLVQGKRGSDATSGGAGSDELRGRRGADALSGGNGDDELHGGAASDDLDGDSGRNKLNGGTGRNFCRNGPVLINCGAH